MTRQHFELIAEVLAQESMAARVLGRGEAAERQMRIVTANFAGRLAATNPNFDKERFIAAATGKEKTYA